MANCSLSWPPKTELKNNLVKHLSANLKVFFVPVVSNVDNFTSNFHPRKQASLRVVVKSCVKNQVRCKHRHVFTQLCLSASLPVACVLSYIWLFSIPWIVVAYIIRMMLVT